MRGATKVKERISRKSRDRERDKSAVLPILPIQWILSFSLEVALILWPYLCHGILLLQNTKNPMSQKQLSCQSTTNKNIFGLLQNGQLLTADLIRLRTPQINFVLTFAFAYVIDWTEAPSTNFLHRNSTRIRPNITSIMGCFSWKNLTHSFKLVFLTPSTISPPTSR